MDAVALVPGKTGSCLALQGSTTKKLKKLDETIAFLESLPVPTTVIGQMGGAGQNIFVRATQLGHKVSRLPWFALQDITGTGKGADEAERATALRLAFSEKPEAFYVLSHDEKMHLVRQLTRTRLTIQDIRKQAQLQYLATGRDLAPLLPDDSSKLASIRTFFANPRMIEGAIEDEKALEGQIKSLVKDIPIWDWLHPGPDAVLPQVKGLGPSLGGSLIGEIGTIQRFPNASHLRAYARFHVNAEGGMPRRKTGQVSNWNNYLHRAIWLWSTDQVARHDHIWRDVYYYFKSDELEKHPETEIRDGAKKYYTLGHLDKRAKRRTGSLLLEYVFELWQAGEESGNPESWYAQSRWPALFAEVQLDLNEGMRAFVDSEIERRRGTSTDEEEA